MPVKFYIASKLENADQVSRVAAAMKAEGHIHTYDWTVHGSVQRDGPERLREVAEKEKQGVLDAEMVIVLFPGGRGTHAELGMAIAKNKPVILCAENDSLFLDDGNTCAFYWNPCCARCTGNLERRIEDILLMARCIEQERQNELEDVLSDTQTGKLAFRCIECNKISVYRARFSDGRTCAHCRGFITPLGYAKAGAKVNG